MAQVKFKITSDAVVTRGTIFTLPDDPQAPGTLIANMAVGEMEMNIADGERCVIVLSIIGELDATASATVTSSGNDLIWPSPATVAVTQPGVWTGTTARFDIV